MRQKQSKSLVKLKLNLALVSSVLQGHWPVSSLQLLFIEALWTNFCSPRMNPPADENLLSSLTFSQMKKKKSPQSVPHHPPYYKIKRQLSGFGPWSLRANADEALMSITASRCCCNSHIKTLYGHIMRGRRCCLDWCASWLQVANAVFMHLHKLKPH